MFTHTTMFLRRTREQLTLVTITLTLWAVTGAPLPQRSRAEVEEGSETTEKAVITAISLGLAVGLGAAITAVVHKYQGQIR